MCGKCWIKGIISAIAAYLLILVLLFSLKNDVNIYVFSLVMLILVGIAMMFCPMKCMCKMHSEESCVCEKKPARKKK